MKNKLKENFFLSDTNQVAIDLLGKEINFFGKKLIITETESYTQGEPSSHSTRKKYENQDKNSSNAFAMFLRGGHSYVYLIYGMWNCLNFVTNAEGTGDAVLIRGGFDVENNILIDSKPGICCKHLGITTNHSKIDTCKDDNFFIKDIGLNNIDYEKLARVGLNKNNSDYYDLKRYKIKDLKGFTKKLYTN